MLRFPYVPDYASPFEENPRIRSAQFGDGYEQRSADGIRSILQKWSVKLSARTSADKEQIVQFFRAHGGVTTFEFLVPDSAWTVTGENFGTGNGTRTQFQLRRLVLNLAGASSMDGAYRLCSDFTSGPTIYVAGVAKVAGTDYSLSSSGLVTFTAAPANGAALTFTGAGDDVLTVVTKGPWTPSPVGPNAWDISATFQEVQG